MRKSLWVAAVGALVAGGLVFAAPPPRGGGGQGGEGGGQKGPPPQRGEGDKGGGGQGGGGQGGGGQGGGGGPTSRPSPDQLFDRADTNRDNMLSREEFKKFLAARRPAPPPPR